VHLSDRDLKAALASKAIMVTPLGENAIQPASIDLRLGGSVQRWINDPSRPSFGYPRSLGLIGAQDMRAENYGEGANFTIAPMEMLLGVTMETVGLDPEHIGWLEGRSTIGRQGLQIHCAGLVDPGFYGTLTLELCNLAPFTMVLTVGQSIGQLVVGRLTSAVERPYGSEGLGSRYQGQQAATPARDGRPAWVPRGG